ncbi:FAD-dependent oxidoreductase [Neolewinella agarilytica]|uniref:FAD dependent oxidoreductase n=1 Tax=Neolewinella agarilytica TaxID=478744 RepID=A0A1H9M4D5_9BACT|nr:FAD-dependent oxidoreductase [Neolewinella agarilytica]SER18568.1 FAD dependent oxidoreductase [Neolewinella agarilytica]
MNQFLFLFLLALFPVTVFGQQDFLLEAESFPTPGGWLTDQQFVEQMGSSYLIAHGSGQPVQDASAEIKLSEKGLYHVWARTKNWVPGNWEAPGRFLIEINGKSLSNELGLSPGWGWEYAGSIKNRGKTLRISLRDLTGFDGRCDAIYFSQDREAVLPDGGEALAEWRKEKDGSPEAPETNKAYDLVVTGGGISGCAAAMAAAERGLRVALIHDRPVLGGNASSEIRVHTLGIYGKFARLLKLIDTEKYPNGHPDAIKDQQKRDDNMASFPNIDLYLNWRAYDAVSADNQIRHVDARHTRTNERIRFSAPLYVDATGDGWIGYWAGAEFSYGRESVDTYGEEWDKWGEVWSPEEADNAVMGSSILFQTRVAEKPVAFPEVPWAAPVAGEHAAVAGEWYWEFTRDDLHQIDDAEEIRDHLLRAIYGSYANAKKLPENANYAIDWVGYLVGKRESRRLVGDHIFTFNDVRNNTPFPDSVVQEIRAVDVHYQRNLLEEDTPDFLSEALFYRNGVYFIPYRSLYSKNISNLFMAGRNFSCSHIGLGGPRVMNTCGQMGAAVGFAASLCKKYGVGPRAIYEVHLKEYMQLIEDQQETQLPEKR